MRRPHAAAMITTAVFVAAAASICAGAAENNYFAAKSDPPVHHHWKAPKAAARRPNPVPADSASLRRGKNIFEARCEPCHGSSGKGDGPAARAIIPRPADLTVAAREHTAGDLAWKIANGRSPMPAWKDELSETQIWDVVNYLESLSGKDRRHGDRREDHH